MGTLTDLTLKGFGVARLITSAAFQTAETFAERVEPTLEAASVPAPVRPNALVATSRDVAGAVLDWQVKLATSVTQAIESGLGLEAAAAE